MGARKEREMQIIDTEPNTDNACRQRGARRVSKKLKLKGLHFTARLAPASQREKQMRTNLVLILKNDIFAKPNRMKMVIVSSREFRANQRKYFDLALTNDVVITSRSHGSYRLVPVRESDTLIDQNTLEAKIRRGIEEYEQGKVHRMEEGENVDSFLSRMINED